MASNSPFGPSSARAYVATGDLAFGLLRMYGVFGSTVSQSELLQVFRDIEEAKRWLNDVRAKAAQATPRAARTG
jgi:hypothetical protein